MTPQQLLGVLIRMAGLSVIGFVLYSLFLAVVVSFFSTPAFTDPEVLKQFPDGVRDVLGSRPTVLSPMTVALTGSLLLVGVALIAAADQIARMCYWRPRRTPKLVSGAVTA